MAPDQNEEIFFPKLSDDDLLPMMDDSKTLSMHTPSPKVFAPSKPESSKEPIKPSSSTRSATLEVPLSFDQGRLSLERRNRLSVHSSVPLTRRLHADIEASSGMRGRIGYGSSTAKVEYRLSYWRVSSGVTAAESPYLHLGGRYAGKSTLAVHFSAKPESLQHWSWWKATASARYPVGWLALRSNATLTSRSQPMRVGCSLEASTRHWWMLGCQWNRLEHWPTLSASVSPQTSRVRVSASWSGHEGWWRLGWQLTRSQKESSVTQLVMGISQFSCKGWTLLLSATVGGVCTIRVPVAITTKRLENESATWMLAIEAVYLSLFAHVTQQALARILMPKIKDDKNTTTTGLDGQKARTMAVDQQQLMMRQAKSRKAIEEKQAGLVIQRAVYFMDDKSLDVTVPLQFWVTDSALKLPASSKRHLLGFYDMSVENDATPEDASWWAGFWTRDQSSKKNGRKTPKLTIEYQYAGLSHSLTIDDDQPVSLPGEHR